MKTLTQVQSAGYRVEQRVRLDHGGPWGNERAVPLSLPAESGASRYIKNEMTQLSSQLLPADKKASARAAIAQGDVVLLGAEDFTSEPTVTRFEEREGQVRRGGPGGYPYREKEYTTLGSQSLSDFVRQSTGLPTATWAIKPQVGSYPDAPELYVFVPVGSAGAVSEQDANGLVFGKFGEKAAAPKADPGNVRVEDDAVFIGGIRVDRRHGYIIQVTRPKRA